MAAFRGTSRQRSLLEVEGGCLVAASAARLGRRRLLPLRGEAVSETPGAKARSPLRVAGCALRELALTSVCGRSARQLGKREREHAARAAGLTSLYFCRYTLSGSTYSSKPSVLMAHSKSSPLMVLRFSRWHLSLALRDDAGDASARRGALAQDAPRRGRAGGPCFVTQKASRPAPDAQPPPRRSAQRRDAQRRARATHSLVMKLINSETHSCTVSLASLAIFAFAGSARFMMREMFAMGR